MKASIDLLVAVNTCLVQLRSYVLQKSMSAGSTFTAGSDSI